MRRPFNNLIFGILSLLLVSTTFAQTTQRSKPSPVEHIGQPMMNGQRLPFSDAVRVGDMYYLSAVAGETPDGKLLEGFEAQARKAMDNVGAVLKRSGLTYRDLVKCTILFENMDDWPAFNKIYATYFPDGRFPARTSLGTDGLPVGALIEIECWAFAGNRLQSPLRSDASSGNNSGLVGTWRLVAYEERTEDGRTIPRWDGRVEGRLIYDDRGRMSVQHTRPELDPKRKPFASGDPLAGTDAEVRAAIEGYVAYFGSYTVDAKAGIVTHHVTSSLFPNLIGTDLRRFFSLSGTRLTLSTPPLLRGGRTSIYVLVWEREGSTGEGAANPRDVSEAEKIVQRQLEAYNARDLKAFAATYGDDVVIYRAPETSPAISGKQKLIEFYRDSRFNLPKLHAEILQRTVIGNKVIDHERITGLSPEPVEALAVYVVRDGLIHQVWLFNAEQ